MKRLLFLLGLLIASPAATQVCYDTPPSGSCDTKQVRIVCSTGKVYTCQSGTWQQEAAGVGDGDMLGPGSSTDNKVPRYEGTSGTQLGYVADGPVITDTGDLQTKGPVANVKAFGALCDGSTDDGAAINAAIAAQPQWSGGTGGGDIFIPQGVCMTSVPIVLANVGSRLRGENARTSVIKATSGFTPGADGAIVVFKEGISGGSDKATAARISDLSIDANDVDAHALLMIEPYDQVSIDNVYVNNCEDAYNCLRIVASPEADGNVVSQTIAINNSSFWKGGTATTAAAVYLQGTQEVVINGSKAFGGSGSTAGAGGTQVAPAWHIDGGRGIVMNGVSAALSDGPCILLEGTFNTVSGVGIYTPTIESCDTILETKGTLEVNAVSFHNPRYQYNTFNGVIKLDELERSEIFANGATVSLSANTDQNRIFVQRPSHALNGPVGTGIDCGLVTDGSCGTDNEIRSVDNAVDNYASVNVPFATRKATTPEIQWRVPFHDPLYWWAAWSAADPNDFGWQLGVEDGVTNPVWLRVDTAGGDFTVNGNKDKDWTINVDWVTGTNPIWRADFSEDAWQSNKKIATSSGLQLGSLTLASATCIGVSADRTFGDLDCDGVKDTTPAEQFLDETGGGGISDGDKTDITVSSTGTVWTIDANAVTDAKASDTLTSSLFVGSGSTTTAVDLATAEVAGVLPDANVSNTLTIDSGTINNAALDADLGQIGGLSCTNGQILEKAAGVWSCQADDTGGGGVTDGDKTDITVSASGTVWTIDNNAVTYGRMQLVGGSKLLGNDAVGTSAVEEITVNLPLTMAAGVGLDVTDASATVSGVVNTTTQIFAGDKTFVDDVVALTFDAPPDDDTGGSITLKEATDAGENCGLAGDRVCLWQLKLPDTGIIAGANTPEGDSRHVMDEYGRIPASALQMAQTGQVVGTEFIWDFGVGLTDGCTSMSSAGCDVDVESRDPGFLSTGSFSCTGAGMAGVTSGAIKFCDSSNVEQVTVKRDNPIVAGRVAFDLFSPFAVSDDLCTGNKGQFWYDTTNNRFEFCNADSGTPLELGGVGAISFTDLDDVPSDYTGDAGKVVRVNSTPNGLEFADAINVDHSTVPTPAVGDMLYWSGAEYDRLPIGGSGTYLSSSGSAISWASPPGGGTIENVAFSSAWDADTDGASKNVIYDQLHIGDADDDGLIQRIDTTSNGFVKTTGGTGTLSVDTATYLTAEVDGSTTNEIEAAPGTYPTAFNGDDAGTVTRDDLYDLHHISDVDDDGLIDKIDADSPVPDAAGEIVMDTTANQIVAFGAAARTFDPRQTLSAVLMSPVDADTPLIFKAPYGMTITDIDCITGAATSAIIDVQECTSAGASCATVDATITCDADGAADDGTLTNGAIDLGDWIKLDMGTVTGTVGFVSVTITYLVVQE